MRLRDGTAEQGQAAVESALTIPLMLLALLGMLQISMAYHARILTEYAAFKAARAASVYRLDCGHITKAALVALVPSIGNLGGGTSLRTRFLGTARKVLSSNRTRGGTPIVLVDYELTDRLDPGQFDKALDSGKPMKVHVKVAYFYEYRIPFVNWVITKYWLAIQTGMRWAQNDPTLLMLDADQPRKTGAVEAQLVAYARRGIQAGYYTAPIVSTWSMRMMSDPLPGAADSATCQ
ncbi:MAG: pilus assembly protein [Deltaproteobacteria bacterium]|nr:pilus assembly protein [Deltaproteobacteria bacterium]